VAACVAVQPPHGSAALRRGDLAPTWLEQFERWLGDAKDGGVADPSAMVVATASSDARPSARTVLLRDLGDRGFVFFTNYQSRKGRELAVNPYACLVFLWDEIGRQVVVDGEVEPLSAGESDAYFARRPYGSRISALASPQSQVVASREVLEQRHAELRRAHPEGSPVPRPESWGGIRVVPTAVEFWQRRPDRLHDRLRFRKDGAGWLVERLAP
jgi:pyridoxamine 5'-phosphate oxidase